MGFRIRAEGDAGRDLPGHGRGRCREAEVKAVLSSRSLRRNRAEGTTTLGHQLVLVRARTDGQALSQIEVRFGSLLESVGEHRADDGRV